MKDYLLFSLLVINLTDRSSWNKLFKYIGNNYKDRQDNVTILKLILQINKY